MWFSTSCAGAIVAVATDGLRWPRKPHHQSAAWDFDNTSLVYTYGTYRVVRDPSTTHPYTTCTVATHTAYQGPTLARTWIPVNSYCVVHYTTTLPNTSSLGSTHAPHCLDKHGAGAARKVRGYYESWTTREGTCILTSPLSCRHPSATLSLEGPDGCHEWSPTHETLTPTESPTFVRTREQQQQREAPWATSYPVSLLHHGASVAVYSVPSYPAYTVLVSTRPASTACCHMETALQDDQGERRLAGACLCAFRPILA